MITSIIEVLGMTEGLGGVPEPAERNCTFQSCRWISGGSELIVEDVRK
jgi:hypothetical protein